MTWYPMPVAITVTLAFAVLRFFNPEIVNSALAGFELTIGLASLFYAGVLMGKLALRAFRRPTLSLLPAVTGACTVFVACGAVAHGLVGAALGLLPFVVAVPVLSRKAIANAVVGVAVASAAILIALAVAAAKQDPPTKQVVFIGLDGADWPIIDKMRAEGRLPSIDGLVKEGARAQMQTLIPILSPPIWTSIASGVTPEKHGIKDFFVSSLMVRAKRLWEIADEHGLRSGVFGYLVTWPPKKQGGFLVPGWEAQGPETYPPSLSFVKQLEQTGKGTRTASPLQLAQWGFEALQHGMSIDTLHALASFTVARKVGNTDDRELAFLARILKLRLSTDVFCHLLRTETLDFVVYFNSVLDSVEHLFFKYYAPEGFSVSEADAAKFGSAIPSAYEEADAAVARILRWISPGADVVMVSDHGQKPASSDGKEWSVIRAGVLLEALGVEDEVRATNQGANLYLRAAHDVPPGWELPTKLRTIEVLGDGGGALLDVTERAPGELAVRVKPSIDVRRAADRLVRVGARQLRLADIVTAADRVSGTHTETSVFVLAGPRAARGADLGRHSVLDIAPTTLALLALPIARDLDGEVLTDALEPGQRSALNLTYAETYGAVNTGGSVDTKLSTRTMEQLRELGYVE